MPVDFSKLLNGITHILQWLGQLSGLHFGSTLEINWKAFLMYNFFLGNLLGIIK